MNGIQEVSGSIPLSSTTKKPSTSGRLFLKKLIQILIMSLHHSLIFITISLVLLLSAGCKDTVTGQDIDNRVMPDSNVSFSVDIYPILNVKCATAGCHNDESRAGGYALTSWTNVRHPDLIDPGQPDNSRLVWSIEARAGIPPMPPIGYNTPLTLNQIRGVRTWIAEGAENN